MFGLITCKDSAQNKDMQSIVRRDEYYKMAVHKLTGKKEQRNAFRNAFGNASEKKMINLRFNFLIEGGLMLFQ